MPGLSLSDGTWALAGMVQLTINLSHGFSAGVAADGIMAGAQLVDVPELSLRKRLMGNSSLGFSLGVRF